jgi:hypothetical protein
MGAPNKRWWFVDPEGNIFISIGVDSVTVGRTKKTLTALADKFGSEEIWADKVSEFLLKNGFNSAGAWSSHKILHKAGHTPPYTMCLNFMAEYGREKKVARMAAGHFGIMD